MFEQDGGEGGQGLVGTPPRTTLIRQSGPSSCSLHVVLLAARRVFVLLATCLTASRTGRPLSGGCEWSRWRRGGGVWLRVRGVHGRHLPLSLCWRRRVDRCAVWSCRVPAVSLTRMARLYRSCALSHAALHCTGRVGGGRGLYTCSITIRCDASTQPCSALHTRQKRGRHGSWAFPRRASDDARQGDDPVQLGALLLVKHESPVARVHCRVRPVLPPLPAQSREDDVTSGGRNGLKSAERREEHGGRVGTAPPLARTARRECGCILHSCGQNGRVPLVHVHPCSAWDRGWERGRRSPHATRSSHTTALLGGG